MSKDASEAGSIAVLRQPARPLLIAFSSTFLAVLCITVQARSQEMSDGAPLGQSRMFVATSEEIAKDKPLKDRREEGQPVNSLRDMFEALRACWVPPPLEKSRFGMEYTIMFAFKRDGELIAPARVTYSTHGVPEEVRNAYYEAVEAAFRRCAPMHFSTGMAGAIAGRPLVFHIFDDRVPFLAPAQDGQLK